MSENPHPNGPATDADDTGTDETATSTGAEGGQDNEPDPDGADSLGDAGKRALDSMKSRWKDERDKRRALEARIAELEAPKPASDDNQPDTDAIKREAAREALSKANARILKSEIKAAAAGKFADPADALAFIDLTSFEVNDDGEVDADEINEAIEDLLTRKPHLAATAKPRFKGSGDGGAARKATAQQLTRDDLKRMTPEAIHKAKLEGRLNNVLGIK